METSLQHKTKSSIHRRTRTRRSDDRASIVVGMTPGESLRVSQECTARLGFSQGKLNALRKSAEDMGGRSSSVLLLKRHSPDKESKTGMAPPTVAIRPKVRTVPNRKEG